MIRISMRDRHSARVQSASSPAANVFIVLIMVFSLRCVSFVSVHKNRRLRGLSGTYVRQRNNPGRAVNQPAISFKGALPLLRPSGRGFPATISGDTRLNTATQAKVGHARTHEIGESLMSDRVSINISAHIAQVTLTRADKMNALDTAMFEAICEAIDALKAESDVRAVVVSGEGRAFCAGLDLSNFAEDKEPMDLMRTHGLANVPQQVAWGWRTLPMPVIAAAHGVALGGVSTSCPARTFALSTRRRAAP